MYSFCNQIQKKLNLAKIKGKGHLEIEDKYISQNELDELKECLFSIKKVNTKKKSYYLIYE